MADYIIKDDGKLHTRYSELTRCTPGQIDRVVWERSHPDSRAHTEHMDFGIVRHEIFEEDGRRAGGVPTEFGIDLPLSHFEHEFATEILPGVVVHSRPDGVAAAKNMIIDYKTVVNGKMGWQKIVNSYRHTGKQRQLQFYAFQLGLHGILIRQGAFLCEIWDADRENILDYKVVTFDIKLRDIAPVLPWVKDRVALLQTVLEEQAELDRVIGNGPGDVSGLGALV